MNKNQAKELLKKDLSFLQSLSVPEYTLYRNGSHKNTNKMINWYNNNEKLIKSIKKNIWTPKTPDDYKNLNIDVIPVDNNKLSLKGRILREMIHSATGHASPGRMSRYIIVHKENSKTPFGVDYEKHKYLGIISLASDFIGVGGRDEKIGGTKEDRMKGGMLKHTCMGSSIVPTQPFGYNYLGGKLISLMVCSKITENFGNNKYKENLVGITTTSLYGGFSQYNRLKYWIKCKSTEGKVKIEPSEQVYDELRKGMRDNHPEHYPYNPENGIISHPKQRIISFLSKELNINFQNSTFKRGVYWCPLYENSHDFLRREHEQLGKKRFDNSVDSLVSIGKERYAKKRVEKLQEENRLSEEILYYDDLIGMEGKEVKEKYIHNVGR